MALSLRRWRPRHLLLAWGAYWLALLAVALGRPALEAWRMSRRPDAHGTISAGVDDAVAHLSIAVDGAPAWSGSASILSITLWLVGPPLVLWVLWLLRSRGSEEGDALRAAPAPGALRAPPPDLDGLRHRTPIPVERDRPAGAPTSPPPRQPMTTPAIPLAEFDAEMATTRRLLERVPDDRGEWKPHEKSFPLAHLAQLIAGMPGWIADTLRNPTIDLAAGPGYSVERTTTLLERFDGAVREARAALQEVAGDALDASWSLTMGEQELLTMPKGTAARSHLNHLIHHRGQLTVYLRLVDVPLPQIYGPTADERGFGGS